MENYIDWPLLSRTLGLPNTPPQTWWWRRDKFGYQASKAIRRKTFGKDIGELISQKGMNETLWLPKAMRSRTK